MLCVQHVNLCKISRISRNIKIVESRNIGKFPKKKRSLLYRGSRLPLETIQRMYSVSLPYNTVKSLSLKTVKQN